MAREGEEDAGDGELTPLVITLVLVGLAVGTILRFTETQLLPLARDKCCKVEAPPYTLSVFLIGLGLSAVADFSASSHNTFVEAILSAQDVDPEVILLVLLPPLIYESAASMNFHIFSRVLPSVTAME